MWCCCFFVLGCDVLFCIVCCTALCVVLHCVLYCAVYARCAISCFVICCTGDVLRVTVVIYYTGALQGPPQQLHLLLMLSTGYCNMLGGYSGS